MSIKRLVSTLVVGVIVSFYLFPIGFAGLPESLNTKQVLALFGLASFGFQSIRRRSMSLSQPVLISGLYAIVFSIWCYLCVVFNSTNDMSYASYCMSFTVWLGGAYGVYTIAKWFHNELPLSTLTCYLVAVCIAQCILAQLIDSIPSFKYLVDTLIIQDRTPIRVERLYGIGASLDSAGVRFAAVLVLFAHMICTTETERLDTKRSYLLISSFILLTILGAIISRTTLVGTLIGGLYLAYNFVKLKQGALSKSQLRWMAALLIVIAFFFVVTKYLYETNHVARNFIRFAFEMFFNYFEKGEFSSGSSDVLMDMWLWPTNTAGWVFGYGHYDGWYYNTDIGYCRFTLYCGLVGMVLFSLFFVYNSFAVSRMYCQGGVLAFCLLVLVFVVWFKVSTDIFQIYALLFVVANGVSYEENIKQEQLDSAQI